MRITLKEKIEMYDVYDIGNLKYIITLFKRYGKKAFDHNKVKTYIRDYSN